MLCKKTPAPSNTCRVHIYFFVMHVLSYLVRSHEAVLEQRFALRVRGVCSIRHSTSSKFASHDTYKQAVDILDPYSCYPQMHCWSHSQATIYTLPVVCKQICRGCTGLVGIFSASRECVPSRIADVRAHSFIVARTLACVRNNEHARIVARPTKLPTTHLALP